MTEQERTDIICEVCGNNSWKAQGYKIAPMTGEIDELWCRFCYNMLPLTEDRERNENPKKPKVFGNKIMTKKDFNKI